MMWWWLLITVLCKLAQGAKKTDDLRSLRAPVEAAANVTFDAKDENSNIISNVYVRLVMCIDGR